ncbi:Gfo/Idh/MocA family protein [Pelagovum pacificum]|uniref:Gfo/Idh/MocA family oxidoreductase n=1 Tax=Pelagovum pacificum TaxID=2588711 RepID=A0A5C5GHI1_9RHOB|nr:Gfo/Idh/MocA family oxidoreductase [Pelagovum pacificum]QQA43513.1 Gfo/Idh/MocA family oxidoreductase [Pelagovum pacificum]TNY33351.1 Gfo/Idh/MocA family oxidoreductase [Pelagovum pacificum]
MLRIGLLGAANIAGRSIVQPCARSDAATLAAVAARRPGAAADYAAEHGIATAHDSYEALLEDDGVDAIYIALPPALHFDWTLKAFKAGKPVLVEKPIGMTEAEARQMVDTAKAAGLILMEAFHDRYHPAFLHLLSRLPDLGKITGAEARFHVDVPWNPANIRFDPAMGGGCMMDLGCYPLHWLRCALGAEPEVRQATAELTELGMDRRIEAELDFDGVPARMTADLIDPPFRATLTIMGENGTLTLDNPCLPHNGHFLREEIAGAPVRQYTVAGGTTYDYQLAAFVEAVRTGQRPLTGGADAFANMAALEAIYRKVGLR